MFKNIVATFVYLHLFKKFNYKTPRQKLVDTLVDEIVRISISSRLLSFAFLCYRDMLDSIRLFYNNCLVRLNSLFEFKSEQANNWILSVNSFSWRWYILQHFVLSFVGVASKLWASK